MSQADQREESRTPEGGGFTPALEKLTRYAALALAAIYATGFVIISIHHALYGIPVSSPVKPRIFPSGVISLLLLVLPVLAASREFVMFRKKTPVEEEFKAERLFQLTIIRILWFAISSVSIVFLGQLAVDARGATGNPGGGEHSGVHRRLGCGRVLL